MTDKKSQRLHSDTARACENGQRALQNLLVIVARECLRGGYDDVLREACAARAALIKAADRETAEAYEVHKSRRREQHAKRAPSLRMVG